MNEKDGISVSSSCASQEVCDEVATKFKCSNCGMSTFQSMDALNTHQIECKRNCQLVTPQNDKVSANVSAHIKFTNEVFLCSSCGTYKNCDLFIHMRKFHRRYICLFCFHMSSSSELLDEHLNNKHKVVSQNYSNIEALQKLSPKSIILLCLRCDKHFSQKEDFTNHKCVNKQSSKYENPYHSKKIKLDNTRGYDSADAVSTEKLESSMKKNAQAKNPSSHLERSESNPSGMHLHSHGFKEDNVSMKIPGEECGNFVPEKIRENTISKENKPMIEDIEHKEDKYFRYVSEANTMISENKKIPPKYENISLPIENNKLKLPREPESENESKNIQKTSLVVDENTKNSDIKPKKPEDEKKDEYVENEAVDEKYENLTMKKEVSKNIPLEKENKDDNIEKVPIQLLLKEYVQAAYMSCNFCRHAVSIAVNGKQLALHLLSEHSCIPVKNDDDIRKLKSSLNDLDKLYLNSQSYDSSDTSIHIPCDQENNFNCLHCHYSSSNYKVMYAHNRKSHVQYHLLCIMCKINFYSYSELICHLCKGCYIPELVKSLDLSFRCCFCKLDMIPSAFRLMVHLRKSHHACDICLEIYTDQKNLSTHISKHKLNHLCTRCGIAYSSKSDMKEHLFWKHGTESVLCEKCLQKKWPHVYHFCIPPTIFSCEECNLRFSKAVALKVHKRIHCNDFPYACSKCDRNFVSKKLLSRHVERHNALLQKKKFTSQEGPKNETLNVTNFGVEPLKTSNGDSNKESESIDIKDKDKDKDKIKKKMVDLLNLPPLNLSESDSSDDESNMTGNPTQYNENPVDNNQDNLNGFPPMISDESKFDENTSQNKRVDGIWENVYQSNVQNPTFSYPLSAIKPQEVYSNNLDTTSEGNNRSSSDSINDTISSTCTCGTNCNCSDSFSSSSSRSHSSSSPLENITSGDSSSSPPENITSSDSISSPPENTTKQENGEKKVEVTPVLELEDPTIRESELETDETTSDEEFYDRHLKKIVTLKLKTRPKTTILPNRSLATMAGGSGGETDNICLGKRRRVKNKFYGFSSSEDEEESQKNKKW